VRRFPGIGKLWMSISLTWWEKFSLGAATGCWLSAARRLNFGYVAQNSGEFILTNTATAAVPQLAWVTP
jgi:hypothetical protein